MIIKNIPFVKLFLLGLSLVLCEGLARVYFLFDFNGMETARRIMSGQSRNQAQFQRCLPQAYLLYSPTPDFKDAFGKQHASGGFRGPSVPVRRTDDVKRIICLGGSTTYGWGVMKQDQTYPYQLMTLLNQSLPKNNIERVEVINAGLPSGTSAEMLTHYLLKYHYYKPDLVIINTGGNDAGALLTKHYHPDYSHTRRQLEGPVVLSGIGKWLARSRLLSLLIIPLFEGLKPNEMIVYNYKDDPPRTYWYRPEKKAVGGLTYTEIPAEENAFVHNLNVLLDQIKKDKADVLLIPFRSNPKRGDWAEEGHKLTEKLLKQIATERSLPLAPFPADIITSGNWVDFCHLNTAGNREKALHLLPFVEKLIF